VARANSSSADLFLSIHHDAVPDSFLQNWVYQGQPHQYSDRFKGHSIWISRDNHDYSTSLQFGKLLGNELKARGLKYTTHYTEKFMGHNRWPLVDSEAGVYRHDALIVLKDTRIPAVLLEAGSIINRDEELVMQSPERQGVIAAAVTEAVGQFCAARGPNTPQRIARERGSAVVNHAKQR
jgi:N-acetylmuramoyl-L-alanine amidase